MHSGVARGMGGGGRGGPPRAARPGGGILDKLYVIILHNHYLAISLIC